MVHDLTQYTPLFNTKTTHGQVVDSNYSGSAILMALFSIVLRIGFILIQVGCVPVESVYLILLQNIINIAFTLIVYIFLGSFLSLGEKSLNGLIGYNCWLINKEPVDFDEAIHGFSAALIGTAIILTFICARTTIVATLVITIFYSGLVQPLIMHWIWHSNGIMNKFKLFNKRVSVKDYGGDVVIHISASAVGLIGATFLGRRIIKLNEIDDFSIRSPNSTIAGYFLIILGLIAFTLPIQSQLHSEKSTNVVLLNNVMAMAGGILVVSFINFLTCSDTLRYWLLIRCMQGSLTGVVSVAAGIDIYHPLVAFGLAGLAAFLYFLVSNLMLQTWVEDSCNLTAVHFTGGIIGILAPAFCACKENMGYSVSFKYQMLHFLWQFICTSTVVTITLILFALIISLLYWTDKFRNAFEDVNHYRSQIIDYYVPREGCCKRLFKCTTERIDPHRNSITETNRSNTALPLQHKSSIKFSTIEFIPSDLSLPEETTIEDTNKTSSPQVYYVSVDRRHIFAPTIQYTPRMLEKFNSEKFRIHRTRKSLNLLQEGKEDEQLPQEHQSEDTVIFPKNTSENEKCDDEFITIKAPDSNMEYFSDSETIGLEENNS